MKKIMAIFLVLFVFGLNSCQQKRSSQYSSVNPRPVEGMETVYYDLDQAVIKQDQIANLNTNAQVMRDRPNLGITIEGHCDERGTNEYNIALGDRRAQSAKNYLINSGIDPNRMSTVSYGEEKPACQDSDESCWWRNRRAEFLKR